MGRKKPKFWQWNEWLEKLKEQSYKAPLISANMTEWQSDKCYSLTSCVKGWWQLPCYAALPCHRRSRRRLLSVVSRPSIYLSVRLAIMWRLSLLWKMPQSVQLSFPLPLFPPPLGRPTSAFIKGHCGLALKHSWVKIKTYNTFEGLYIVILENAMLT